MMDEDFDELLRQEDEEESFANKYAEELEMMDDMETGWGWWFYVSVFIIRERTIIIIVMSLLSVVS